MSTASPDTWADVVGVATQRAASSSEPYVETASWRSWSWYWHGFGRAKARAELLAPHNLRRCQWLCGAGALMRSTCPSGCRTCISRTPHASLRGA